LLNAILARHIYHITCVHDILEQPVVLRRVCNSLWIVPTYKSKLNLITKLRTHCYPVNCTIVGSYEWTLGRSGTEQDPERQWSDVTTRSISKVEVKYQCQMSHNAPGR